MDVRLKLLLRVCAVGSSSLLVAALVAYRAGAWGGAPQAESTAVAASPSPTTEPAAKAPTERPVLMGGSKSVVLAPLPAERYTPFELRPWPRPTAPPEYTVIFGGSKSLVLDPIPPRASPSSDK
jgi:hypothetical protein